MKGLKTILFAGLTTIILAACASDNAADTVEQYLQAKVAGDAETVQSLLCAEMENTLVREVNAFSSVSAEIKDMSCQPGTTAEQVMCSGQIVALYGTENMTFPLGNYRVVREDEGWKWCGETQ